MCRLTLSRLQQTILFLPSELFGRNISRINIFALYFNCAIHCTLCYAKMFTKVPCLSLHYSLSLYATWNYWDLKRNGRNWSITKRKEHQEITNDHTDPLETSHLLRGSFSQRRIPPTKPATKSILQSSEPISARAKTFQATSACSFDSRVSHTRAETEERLVRILVEPLAVTFQESHASRKTVFVGFWCEVVGQFAKSRSRTVNDGSAAINGAKRTIASFHDDKDNQLAAVTRPFIRLHLMANVPCVFLARPRPRCPSS